MQASVVLKKESDLYKYKWSLSEQGSSMRFNSIINFSRTKPNINHCVMCGDSKSPIPSQNKGVCKTCDSSFWYSHNFDVVFKFCKGCKVFCVLQGFHDKPEASKCLKCRQRGSQSYFMKKTENFNSKFRPEGCDQDPAPVHSEEVIGQKRKADTNIVKCHKKVTTPCSAPFPRLNNVAEVTPKILLNSNSDGELNRTTQDKCAASAYSSSTMITPDGFSCAITGNSAYSTVENKENFTPSGYNFSTSESAFSDSALFESSLCQHEHAHLPIIPKWWDPENPLMNLARLTMEHFES